MMAEQSVQAPTEQASPESNGEITPELVREVAEKVFILWQRELAIERERQRPFTR